MRTKKITLLLMLTVISLLTMFLVLLLDDSVLAAEVPGDQLLPNLNLYQQAPQGMMVPDISFLGAFFLADEPEPMEVV